MIGDLQTARDALFTAMAAVSAITTPIGGAVNPRIYQEVAEQSAAFPLVLIRWIPFTGDVNNVSGTRIMTRAEFRVVAVIDRRSFASVAAIVEGIDSALQTPAGGISVSGGRVLYCRRVRPYQRSYPLDGRHYAESGGDYRVEIQ